MREVESKAKATVLIERALEVSFYSSSLLSANVKLESGEILGGFCNSVGVRVELVSHVYTTV